jgi:hypothetical protein
MSYNFKLLLRVYNGTRRNCLMINTEVKRSHWTAPLRIPKRDPVSFFISTLTDVPSILFAKLSNFVKEFKIQRVRAVRAFVLSCAQISTKKYT